MKPIIFLFITSLMVSCSPIYNYQVLKTEYENLKEVDNYLVFEDENCSIRYNLWTENGKLEFLFTNKTDSLIEVDLKESFLILNGVAFDYFLNRSFSATTGITISNSRSAVISNTNSENQTMNRTQFSTQSNGNATARGLSLSNSSGVEFGTVYGSGIAQSRNKSIEYHEKEVVRIPPGSSKILGEYNLLNSRVKDCDLKKTPNVKEKLDSVQFSKENTPLNFKNMVTYTVSGSEGKKQVSSTFYVTKIMNMLPEEFFFRDHYIGCNGRKSLTTYEFMKYDKPNNFYVRYSRD